MAEPGWKSQDGRKCAYLTRYVFVCLRTVHNDPISTVTTSFIDRHAMTIASLRNKKREVHVYTCVAHVRAATAAACKR